jgi:Phosphoenolpyruvate-dependent sugar phosphotransferase system, EIIA 2.
VVFGRSDFGIEWDSLDGKPVYLVFLLGIPAENAENTHLKILSQLSRKLMDENFVQTLKAASSKDEILYVLNEISK